MGSTANGVGGAATGVVNSGLDDSAGTAGSLLHGTGQGVGVVGSAIPNVQLNTGADASSSGVLTSRGWNVRLESGTSLSLGIVAQ